ncbi:hypothetical protein SAMN05216503_0818 [Polaribacter sp. KT25b]|uniref:DUF6686 family protein n=1 Tax=Polaribacter sp. KT25b TaxID=1855336 RepID=UPI00087AC7D5|nr:DUF6686 family protein [Polaribacter sp. KT25b]SDR76792.1 hypothetical protein SAMN05216503_0818 [Polaribacter sp. KT25b]
MCQNSKIISSVKNGELAVCYGCKNYALTFNNVYFQFDKNQLLEFRKYIANIDVNYWQNYYASTTKKRKIPVTTLHQNLILIFSLEEIEDLKKLLLLKKTSDNDFISLEQINYAFILN